MEHLPQALHESLPGLWRVLRRFRPYLRKERAAIAGSLLALFIGTGLRLLEPWPLKFVFDRAILNGRSGHASHVPSIDALDPTTLLTLSALGLIVITGLRALADYHNGVGFALIGNRLVNEVRHELYRHLQGLSLAFHARSRSGDLVVRVIGDVDRLKDAAVTAVLPLLANVLILIGMWGFMFWLQWKLALLALATVPLFWFSVARLTRRIREAARKQRQREGALAAAAAESIGAIQVVQSLSLEGMFARAFSSRSRKNEQEDLKGRRLSAGLERRVDVLIAIATALVLWYGAWLVLQRALTPGDLLVFLAYLKRAFNPVQDFAKYTGRLAKAAAAGERVVDLLERLPDVRDMPGAVQAPAFRGAVRFEAVSFSYEPGRPVLEDIDLDVRPGERVALVGPSGIGKSTLASLILRLYDPVQGRVAIDGHDVRDFTLASFRSQIGVVLQDSILFAASVRENIGYGAPNSSSEEIEGAARLARAHEFIQALPQGYDTVLGERGVTLSGGQRQRIAIARAAIRRAAILILDEPTRGLDQENERAVIEALERLASGRTTFLITHNLPFAARADLILYLEGGRVLERGSHSKLMEANGRYAALYRLQAAIRRHGLQEPSAHALTS